MVIALSELHIDVNLTHLDLKLENYVLTRNYNGALIDFQFVKPLDQLINEGNGTDTYRAPEQWKSLANGDFYDPEKADIFQLGVCLFILLF